MTMLSLNQATTETTPTRTLVPACAAAGIGAIGLWRHQYVDNDPALTRRLLDDSGIVASSLCRGGFFTGTRTEDEAFTDNCRAVEEAATVGAPQLVLVCGPLLSGQTPAAAETAIVRGIERLLPVAVDHGVGLAVEPFHPMLVAERSAIVTLNQAARVLHALLGPKETADGSPLGLAVDSYHVSWDPELLATLDRLAHLVVAVHIADWLVPTESLLAGRGLPGDGVLDLTGFLDRLRTRGFDGFIEVEVMNPQVWARDPNDVVLDVRDRMSALISSEQ